MDFDRIVQRLIDMTAIRSRRDFYVKPLLLLACILFMAEKLTELMVPNLSSTLLLRLLLVTMITAPFLALFFVLITYLDRLQRKLAELATTDMLTGLHNRRAFLERSRLAHASADQGVVLIIDADYFKSVNDRYGHAAGDACLQAIATRLRKVLRSHDIVGRIGGEEFAAYLPGAPLHEAENIGQRLIADIAVDLESHPDIVNLTLSIGAAEADQRSPLDHFLTLADQALYQAKAQGRARLVVWRQDMGPMAAPTAA